MRNIAKPFYWGTVVCRTSIIRNINYPNSESPNYVCVCVYLNYIFSNVYIWRRILPEMPYFRGSSNCKWTAYVQISFIFKMNIKRKRAVLKLKNDTRYWCLNKVRLKTGENTSNLALEHNIRKATISNVKNSESILLKLQFI